MIERPSLAAAYFANRLIALHQNDIGDCEIDEEDLYAATRLEMGVKPVRTDIWIRMALTVDVIHELPH
jgi:hypothetical protein